MISRKHIPEHLKTMKCSISGHSYEIMDYVPDFDHECYKLQLQCMECGLEEYDKIDKNMKISGEYEYPTDDTSARYFPMRYFKQTEEVFSPTKQQTTTTSNYKMGKEE